MSSTATGRQAEQAAAEYLCRLGYKILELNWRIKAAEIDIVASKDGLIYFAEVKFRRRSDAGSGLDYVTESKLRRMRRAAELWCAYHNYEGEFELSAVEVAGPDFKIENFIAELT